MHRDRFAPSPTGQLHLGHAYSALTAWRSASAAKGQLVLRIEDIDSTRCREEHVKAIVDDLAWLGVTWHGKLTRQSHRSELYRTALEKLSALGICYPCNCTRRDIQAALAAPQEDAVTPAGVTTKPRVYPGTCRYRIMKDATDADSVRLDMKRAIRLLGGSVQVGKLSYTEIGEVHADRYFLDSERLVRNHGDIVLARKDIGTSYHLAVVVDDDLQEITHVTRGEDLFFATDLHRLLQELLDLSVPVWNHHKLIRDAFGNRLAKRKNSKTLRQLREEGKTPESIRKMLQLEDWN